MIQLFSFSEFSTSSMICLRVLNLSGCVSRRFWRFSIDYWCSVMSHCSMRSAAWNSLMDYSLAANWFLRDCQSCSGEGRSSPFLSSKFYLSIQIITKSFASALLIKYIYVVETTFWVAHQFSLICLQTTSLLAARLSQSHRMLQKGWCQTTRKRSLCQRVGR